MLGVAAGQSEAAGLVEPQEETQDKVLGLFPAHGGPGRHCSAAGTGVSVGAVAWERCLETGVGALEMGWEDGTRCARRGRALEAAAGCRRGSLVGVRGGGSSRPDVRRRGRGGGHDGSCGGGACGGGCCFRGNGGGCCGCDGGVE